VRDAEQAFVCAMFHRLGKLLATFYLHEEALMVGRHMQSQGWSEEHASREVLGISYEELGVGVAKAWNFPEEIVESMRHVAGPARGSPDEQGAKLRMVAGLANELSEIVRSGEPAKRDAQIAELAARYGAATGTSDQALVAAVQSSAKALVRDAESLGHGVARSGVLRSANAWRPASESRPPPAAAPPPAAEPGEAEFVVAGLDAVGAETERLVSGARLASHGESAAAPSTGPAEPGKRQAALSAGIQDITNTMVGEHTLNDVLRIILETMYRAIGFTRVLLFVLDPRQQALRCRFGFGEEADAIIQSRVSLPLQGSRDLFYAAVVMGADLCIEDLETDKIRQHVPQWYRKAIGARGIVLLPIVNRKRTMGLIYADSDNPQILRFSAEELGLLKTLRNQALLAMRSAQ
jgi:hypothetical protein